ncbi:hypothetical protein CXG81DRAFT_28547 [Caulochytrium protostelioides]|uniref:Uncharacterized protein n=1 Tax=Caulochytrium protostelioides TaxID=1555241 RepID=A0A4V1ITY2_9FUNG|nr:hypothetical protein CXG81DRAFT_28547 [Caulochytrium protostelioides]|eukprot:RKO98647.1 hypothetical protein CXG81DRAFT_28547 [Caulochytrium protostelioides]
MGVHDGFAIAEFVGHAAPPEPSGAGTAAPSLPMPLPLPMPMPLGRSLTASQLDALADGRPPSLGTGRDTDAMPAGGGPAHHSDNIGVVEIMALHACDKTLFAKSK